MQSSTSKSQVSRLAPCLAKTASTTLFFFFATGVNRFCPLLSCSVVVGGELHAESSQPVITEFYSTVREHTTSETRSRSGTSWLLWVALLLTQSPVSWTPLSGTLPLPFQNLHHIQLPSCRSSGHHPEDHAYIPRMLLFI